MPEVQSCVARQTLKLSDAAVRKYAYALFRLDQDTGQAALKLVNKCPKQVAIFVAEEGERISGLVVGSAGTCSLFANVHRSTLAADFSSLEPALLLAAMQLGLAENISA